ncbi:hypothetical protein KAM426_40680 [Aquipseudomonas alcaligenes]|nr:hypothetical protein KAM426_40680 [Pseudomonas alcaligenes]
MGWSPSQLFHNFERVDAACPKARALGAIGAGGYVHFISTSFDRSAADESTRFAVLVMGSTPFPRTV